eukprot:m.539446 g.539446  ORF g.539446 m.539446 type:complete len:297 (+) comp22091_c0_seq5:957-1847(+)
MHVGEIIETELGWKSNRINQPCYGFVGVYRCKAPSNMTSAPRAGDLHETFSRMLTSNAADADGSSCTHSVNWIHTWIFFGCGVFLTLLTIVVFWLFSRLRATRYFVAREERRLARERATSRDNEHTDAGTDELSPLLQPKHIDAIHGRRDTHAPPEDAKVCTTSINTQHGSERTMGDGGDDTIATTASDTMEFWVFFKRVLPQLIKVALINVNNSLLSSQYGKTTHDDSPHLATYLIYEYYMASAVGTFISMKYRAVPAATMVVAVTRVLSLPLAFLYAYGYFGVRHTALWNGEAR